VNQCRLTIANTLLTQRARDESAHGAKPPPGKKNLPQVRVESIGPWTPA